MASVLARLAQQRLAQVRDPVLSDDIDGYVSSVARTVVELRVLAASGGAGEGSGSRPLKAGRSEASDSAAATSPSVDDADVEDERAKLRQAMLGLLKARQQQPAICRFGKTDLSEEQLLTLVAAVAMFKAANPDGEDRAAVVEAALETYPEYFRREITNGVTVPAWKAKTAELMAHAGVVDKSVAPGPASAAPAAGSVGLPSALAAGSSDSGSVPLPQGVGVARQEPTKPVIASPWRDPIPSATTYEDDRKNDTDKRHTQMALCQEKLRVDAPGLDRLAKALNVTDIRTLVLPLRALVTARAASAIAGDLQMGEALPNYSRDDFNFRELFDRVPAPATSPNDGLSVPQATDVAESAHEQWNIVYRAAVLVRLGGVNSTHGERALPAGWVVLITTLDGRLTFISPITRGSQLAAFRAAEKDMDRPSEKLVVGPREINGAAGAMSEGAVGGDMSESQAVVIRQLYGNAARLGAFLESFAYFDRFAADDEARVGELHGIIRFLCFVWASAVERLDVNAAASV